MVTGKCNMGSVKGPVGVLAGGGSGTIHVDWGVAGMDRDNEVGGTGKSKILIGRENQGKIASASSS